MLPLNKMSEGSGACSPGRVTTLSRSNYNNSCDETVASLTGESRVRGLERDLMPGTFYRDLLPGTLLRDLLSVYSIEISCQYTLFRSHTSTLY